MSSGGVRNVYTHPVVRSNSKFDVEKNLTKWGAVEYYSALCGLDGESVLD